MSAVQLLDDTALVSFHPSTEDVIISLVTIGFKAHISVISELTVDVVIVEGSNIQTISL